MQIEITVRRGKLRLTTEEVVAKLKNISTQSPPVLSW